jgi:cytochrome c oxidase subunit 3
MSAEIAQAAEQFDTPEQQEQAVTLGMWVFLATELMFFGPLFFGYWYGRMHFPEAFALASRHTEVMLGTVNTAVLLSSSLLMALAVEARKADAARLAGKLLWGVAVLGIVFLVIKGSEYRHEWREHLFPGAGFSFPQDASGAAEMFYFLYFAMTGLHALHLTIGITLVLVFAIALKKNALRFAAAERLEIAALYWHLVDVIWIFLYPILYLVGRSAG